MSPLLLLLVLYPIVCIAAPALFYSLWPDIRPPVQNVAADPEPSTEKKAMARLAALVCLFTFGCLLCGTIVCQQLIFVGPNKFGFFANSRLSTAFIGGYLGLSWAGVSIWFLALGAATGRMRREIPGLMAPLKIQIAVWLTGALAEEMWRVAAIAALASGQNSPRFSVIAVSVIFAIPYLNLGLQRAAFATLEGVFLGFLFLWQGSFLAPFTAHLAIQAVYLWGVGQWGQDRKSRKTWQIPGTKCPVCNARVELLQIKLSDVFDCPSCGERLSLSDGYQNVMRFAAAFGFCSLVLCTMLLLIDWVPANLVVWLTYPISYGAATSALFLYRRAFTRLIPPRLQRGTPYVITLNLDGRRKSKTSDGEDDSNV
jgi:Type II CAAX prenyl endopeptidase Rce1-like